MSPFRGQPGRTRQRGMVLLLCLIFMTALTLLGLTASTDTITQTQLATNLHDSERARQNAQLSLQWAEQWLSALAGPALESCSTGCTGLFAHPADSLEYNLQSASLAWWISHGYEVGLDPDTGARLATVGVPGIDPPIWAIQSLHHSPATAEVIESIVKKNWDESGGVAMSASRVAWQELR